MNGLLVVLAATGLVSFKDANKIKSWDAWNDHKAQVAVTNVLQRERPCVTWKRLNELDYGLEEVGRLATRTSSEIRGSKWSVGCETMDRDYAHWDSYKSLLPMLGVKRARFFSGWAKTEQEKGVYDFTWLDPQIRECAAMSVRPWVCIAYGNPVWGSDFRLGMRVKQVTENPEAFAAWLRYVKALVARYRDVVSEWEVWNEPFGQPKEYAEMFYRTAKAIREVQPEAKVICTALTMKEDMTKSDYAVVLEKLKRENALDLASLFAYHPYSPNPDESYEAGGGQFGWQMAMPLRRLVKSYSANFDILQGEVGCPAQLEFEHAMHSIEWSEYAQAKWELRRAIGDAVRSIPSSVFTMIDLQYTFMLQSFGLIRSNALKEFVYRRPKWYAMRNVYSLFDDDTLPVGVQTGLPAAIERRADPRETGSRALTRADFSRFEKPLHLFWYSDSQPSSGLAFDRVTLTVPGRLSDPVWVEMVTGRVCAFDPMNVRAGDGETVISDVPMWDSPVLVADRAAVPLAPGAVAPRAAYQPEPWNRDARAAFAERRFGIFIHWGLYANYAQGEWYLHHSRLDEAAYARMMYGFCPSKFDAREWARTFRKAGAKYVTITSRHHDGFSLWPTKVDDGYNVANTPFKRDILGELAAACREEGLQFNLYYSLMDWHRPDYPAGPCAQKVRGPQKGDYASYKRFMMAQITELIDSYRPGVIWFDGEWDHTEHRGGRWTRSLDWEFDDIYDLIHSRKTLVANNNHQPIRAKEDVQLFERDLPGDHSDAGFSINQPVTRDRPIEQCDVFQHDVWGYRIGERKFRTAPDVVAMVARAAANDANLLMNVGPDGSGQLPRQTVAAMAEVGSWMEKNGESIYGTAAGGVGLGKDVVSTRRGDALYLHFLKPGIDKFAFRLNGEVSEASCLADGASASVARTPAGDAVVTITRPKGYDFDVVVKLVIGSTVISRPSHATLIAHRGESHDAPENTLPAYRMAVERGFGFECDVYLSADGRVFTFHDGDLTRTSGGALTKRCVEASWEKEVSALNVGGWGRWKGSAYDPTRPALLEEVCALARDGRWIYCEVKGDDTRIVASIRQVLERQRTATPENFLFISFSEKVCAELKRQLPSYKVYWLTDARATVARICETLKRLGADGVDVCYDSKVHDAAFIRAVRAAGYSFHVWTIDDPALAAEALSRGVETVTTNRAQYILNRTNEN